MLFQRFRVVCEIARRLAVYHRNIFYAERFKQLRYGYAPCGIYAVHRHFESGRRYGGGIYCRQCQYHGYMAVYRIRYRYDPSQTVHFGVRIAVFFGQGEHLGPRLCVQKFTFRIEQLQRVPLARVMACSDDYTTVGPQFRYHNFYRRGSGQPKVINIYAHSLERRYHQ